MARVLGSVINIEGHLCEVVIDRECDCAGCVAEYDPELCKAAPMACTEDTEPSVIYRPLEID